MTSVDATTRHARAACAIAAVLSLPAGGARAALGGDLASIDADGARLGARHAVAQVAATGARATAMAAAATPVPSVQVHRLVREDGSTFSEFVRADGRVFAVSWSSRLKPRLEPLLGTLAADYVRGTARAMARPGPRHAVAMEEGDLVLHATTRLNANTGLAYVRSLLPAGVDVDALR